MTAIVTASGGINWVTTRSIVVTNPQCADEIRDYGKGPECAARCPGCDRLLPTVCMHLDHILAQATHATTLFAPRTTVRLLSDGFPHDISTKYEADVVGGSVCIWTLGTQRPGTARQQAMASGPVKAPRNTVSTVLSSLQVWENDLENLQFLCMSCNTSKQHREFAAAFPGRTPNRLVERA